jgi:hypothetical protein
MFDQTRTRQVPEVKEGRGVGKTVHGFGEKTIPDAQNKQEQPLPKQPSHVLIRTSISKNV